MIFALLTTLVLSAQTEVWQHEYAGELPVFIDSLQARLTYPLAWRHWEKTHAEEKTMGRRHSRMEQWRQEARRQVLACMGPQPPRADDWQMEVLAEEQRNGYTAQRIAFNLSRWYRVKAYLLIPTRTEEREVRYDSQPAVLLMHEHGAHLTIGKEKVVRPFAVDSAIINDADAWVRQLYGGQYLGDFLAKNGYVVLAADMPLWGERGRTEGADRKKYDIIAGNMMMAGVNLCAFTHYDDMAAAEFLASLPFVDSQRIATAGLSIGAYRAWMLAALSDRVKAACCDCWMVTTEAQLTTKYGRRENGGFANSIPGLRNYLDYPDIASIAAPNPMLLIAGKRDKLFPIPGVEKAFKVMHEVWDAANASSNLDTYLLDQGHECSLDNQRMILEFLNKHLKP